MSYLQIISGAARGEDAVFQRAVDRGARSYALLNIIILGILYGLSNLVGVYAQGVELPLAGAYLFITPALFGILGIVTMCGATIGLCLVYWAAAKGFGGPAGFGLVLDLVGLSAVPFWVLAPLLNYAIQFAPNREIPIGLVIPIALAFFWTFMVVRKSLVVGQGLSMGKATLAVVSMWIFSTSAVYLFLP
jgi:hypothetical protein